ncbi:hypothetical protein Tco_0881989 [Tanacetum coccineum]
MDAGRAQVELSDWIAFFLGGSQNHLMPFQASFGVGSFIEILWSLVSGDFPISHIVVTRGCVFDKGLLEIFHAILSVVRTNTDLTRGSDFVHLSRLCRVMLVLHHSVELNFRALIRTAIDVSGTS